MKLAFVPIDNRPVCYTLPKLLAEIDESIEFYIPDRKYLGGLKQEADIDHQTMEKKFDSKLEKLETRLQHEIELSNKDVKSEFKNIADKIDEMKTRYVTNENFKTYVDSISQLLKMTSDRMTRMETTLDDIRDDINTVIRSRKTDHFTNP